MLRESATSGTEFWQTVPLSSVWLFYAGVFCLFSTIALVGTMGDNTPLPPLLIVLQTLISGGAAVLIALAAVRHRILLIILIAIAAMATLKYLGHTSAQGFAASMRGSAASHLHALGLVAVFGIAGAWTFLMIFISTQGKRYFRLHTEMSLAREIHQALVPEIRRQVGEFEIYGASVPSGEVGGDLVDLVEDGRSWTAYIADVSGHGVSPGVLMAMFKSAVRSWMLAGCDVRYLLDGVHRALYPLKTANMFVTAGLLHGREQQVVLFLAGHPGLLHFHRSTGRISDYPPQDLPLGILPEQSFTPRQLICEPGDVLLLLTDGFTEVSDRAGDEIGVEPLKSALRQWGALPLAEIFQKLRELVLGFGPQLDDQTMLLVRRLGIDHTL